jgi:hypothetical protein
MTTQAVGATKLNLLTRDGMVEVTYTPLLSPEQYAELLEIVREAETAKELRQVAAKASQRWQRQVSFG